MIARRAPQSSAERHGRCAAGHAELMDTDAPQPHVVNLGGGFGGLWTTRA